MPLQVKVKLPERFNLNAEKMAAYLQTALNETIAEARILFNQSTATFDEKPNWEINRPNGVFTRRLSTTDQNYTRLNYGTKAHLISPKPGGILRFPNAFGPKTRPNSLQAMAGYKSSDMVITRLPVLHPGFPARNFDKEVAKKIEPKFKSKIQAALIEATKA